MQTELKVKMKENQNGYHEEESLSFMTNDFRHSNGQTRDANLSDFRTVEGADFWNAPELECSMVMNDFSKHNKHETRNCGSAFITSSELLQADTHLYTDKNVMESEVKENNYHVVKDICIDEGMPIEDEDLTERHTDDSIPYNEYRQNNKTSEGRLGFKSFVPDGPKASPDEDIDVHADDDCGIKEETKCFQEGSTNKDDRIPEDLTETGEPKSDGRNKIGNDVSEEDSIITRTLPLQEFGTRSFLRSLMATLNNDGDEDPQKTKPILEANLESVTIESEAKESRNGPANDLFNNSDVENGSITFDFDSPEHAAAVSTHSNAETIGQSQKSNDVLNLNDGNTNNALAATLIQHASTDESDVDIYQDSVLNLKNKNSNNPFIVSEVQHTSMDGSAESTHQEALVNHKKGNSNNPFAIDDVQTASADLSSESIHQSRFNPFAIDEVESANMDRDTENIHGPPMPNPETGISNNPFAVCEDQNTSIDESSESIHHQPVLNHAMGRTSNPFSDVESSCIDGDSENIHNNRTSSNPFALSELHESPAEKTEALHKQSFEPRDESNHEGTLNNLSVNDQGQCFNGESSFSAAGPASGLITYTGPITYNGSTSVRSDSSTTSTRSFAFPVLQSEWNSSPVRMRKAEGRHFRKHKGWKQGILCCKF